MPGTAATPLHFVTCLHLLIIVGGQDKEPPHPTQGHPASRQEGGDDREKGFPWTLHLAAEVQKKGVYLAGFGGMGGHTELSFLRSLHDALHFGDMPPETEELIVVLFF